MQSAIRIYAENLVLDYVNDELIRNPFPFPMNNVLDYLYNISNKKGVIYMSENLERAVKKWVESKDTLIYGQSRNYSNFDMQQLSRDEERAKTRVEAEVYKLIGKSAVAGASQSASMKEILNKLTKR